MFALNIWINRSSISSQCEVKILKFSCAKLLEKTTYENDGLAAHLLLTVSYTLYVSYYYFYFFLFFILYFKSFVSFVFVTALAGKTHRDFFVPCPRHKQLWMVTVKCENALCGRLDLCQCSHSEVWHLFLPYLQGNDQLYNETNKFHAFFSSDQAPLRASSTRLVL